MMENGRIILSIKPEYSSKIFTGEKKFEFRTQKPKNPFEIVYVYETNHTKKIVGFFTVKNVIQGSPEELWDKCKYGAGMTEADYFKYCGNKKIVYAFEIDKTHHYESAIDPYILCNNFRPAQSFKYIRENYVFTFLNENCEQELTK